MYLPLHVVGHLFFMILMLILLVIGIIRAHRKGPDWFKKHKQSVLFGIFSGTVGFMIMVIFKVLNKYPHFFSQHSRYGLATLILLIFTPVLGFMLVKQKLRQRLIHIIPGVFVVIIGITAAVLGMIMILHG